MLFGDSLLGIFGAEFVVGYKSLVYMSFVTVLVACCGLSTQLLIMSGYHHFVARVTLIFVPVLLVSVYVGASLDGFSGGVVSYGLCQLIFALVLYYKSRKSLGIDPSFKGGLSYLFMRLLGGRKF